jgi:ZIP family zinc transporter
LIVSSLVLSFWKMHNFNYNAALITLLSGLSTSLGGFVLLFSKKLSASKLSYMLSFSSGIMIYISFVDLLPESSKIIGNLQAKLSVISINFTCFDHH